MVNYYVCSYGGCGSKMLVNYLAGLGKRVFHIHSREPPSGPWPKFPDAARFSGEWFGNEWDPDGLVVYIFRDPVEAVLSRFGDLHLINIEVPQASKVADERKVHGKTKDLLDIEGFHENYTTPKARRQYKILALNYHKLWSEWPLVAGQLGVGSNPPPESKERTNEQRLRENPWLDRTTESDLKEFVTSMDSLRQKMHDAPAVEWV